MDRGARQIGAQLNGRDHAHAQLTADALGNADAVGSVVVREGHRRDTVLMGEPHQLSWCEPPIGNGAMQMQVECHRA